MRIALSEKQIKLITSIVEADSDTTTSASTTTSTSTPTSGGATSTASSGKASYPQVDKWESGITRGPANSIGITKWADVVGSKLTRGHANPLNEQGKPNTTPTKTQTRLPTNSELEKYYNPKPVNTKTQTRLPTDSELEKNYNPKSVNLNNTPGKTDSELNNKKYNITSQMYWGDGKNQDQRIAKALGWGNVTKDYAANIPRDENGKMLAPRGQGNDKRYNGKVFYPKNNKAMEEFPSQPSYNVPNSGLTAFYGDKHLKSVAASNSPEQRLKDAERESLYLYNREKAEIDAAEIEHKKALMNKEQGEVRKKRDEYVMSHGGNQLNPKQGIPLSKFLPIGPSTFGPGSDMIANDAYKMLDYRTNKQLFNIQVKYFPLSGHQHIYTTEGGNFMVDAAHGDIPGMLLDVRRWAFSEAWMITDAILMVLTEGAIEVPMTVLYAMFLINDVYILNRQWDQESIIRVIEDIALLFLHIQHKQVGKFIGKVFNFLKVSSKYIFDSLLNFLNIFPYKSSIKQYLLEKLASFKVIYEKIIEFMSKEFAPEIATVKPLVSTEVKKLPGQLGKIATNLITTKAGKTLISGLAAYASFEALDYIFGAPKGTFREDAQKKQIAQATANLIAQQSDGVNTPESEDFYVKPSDQKNLAIEWANMHMDVFPCLVDFAKNGEFVLILENKNSKDKRKVFRINNQEFYLTELSYLININNEEVFEC
jgi:hypothetical protein